MLFDFQFYDLPYWTKKDYIKDPEAYMKKRDWLINLYFSKPDYEEPFKKVYYAAYAGTKFGIIHIVFLKFYPNRLNLMQDFFWPHFVLFQ